VAIDGTEVRARAGRGSLAQGKKLAHIEAEVSKRVAALKSELSRTPARPMANARRVRCERPRSRPSR
jgi:uncharacterized small protein (DUF1192 family)